MAIVKSYLFTFNPESPANLSSDLKPEPSTTIPTCLIR
jgi:hypothetical protein